MEAKKKKAEVEKPVFTKTQIVTSKKYAMFRDYLTGNLDDNKMYTMQEIDSLLEKMKGKVK